MQMRGPRGVLWKTVIKQTIYSQLPGMALYNYIKKIVLYMNFFVKAMQTHADARAPWCTMENPWGTTGHMRKSALHSFAYSIPDFS